MRLKWTNGAVLDLALIFRFRKNPKIITAIRQSCRLLESQPNMGRKVDDNLREWRIPYGRYGFTALYKIDQDCIIILGVRHQRQSPSHDV